MMKFFRKYMKHMLAVFMALLLVSWLAGDALRYLFQRGGGLKVVQGTSFGQSVTLEDMQPCFFQVEAMEMLGLQWKVLWAYVLKDIGGEEMVYRYYADIRKSKEGKNTRRNIEDGTLTAVEWYMLNAAARKSGIQVPQEAVDRLKKEYGLSDERLAIIRDRKGISLDQLNEAIRSFARILEMIELPARAQKPSEADIQEFIRQTEEKVSIGAVILDAGKFIDKNYQPTAEELQKQFDSGKDNDPVPNSVEKFGYRLPEKVVTEYIKISVEELTKRQTVTDDEAYGYWQQHKDEFKKPATQPTTAPTTQPPPQPEPYDTFTEARTKVLDKLKDEKARREALAIAREELISRLTRPWANAPTTQPDNYKQPPDSEKAADLYPKTVEALEGKKGKIFKYVLLPPMESKDSWGTPEIGTASAFGGTPEAVYFNQAAFMVAGLEAKRDPKKDSARLFRNVFETCMEPLMDSKGNVYVFRTIAAQAKKPPESVDVVRSKLIDDLRRIKAYQEAGKTAKTIAEQADKNGLNSTVESNQELKAKLGDKAFQEVPPFSRKRPAFYGQTGLQTNYVPGIGRDEALVNLCFAIAGQTATQPSRIRLHEMKDQSRWVVIEWQKNIPVTQDEYAKAKEIALKTIQGERLAEFLRSYFAADQIRARINWVDAEARKGETKPANPVQEGPLPPGGWNE